MLCGDKDTAGQAAYSWGWAIRKREQPQHSGARAAAAALAAAAGGAAENDLTPLLAFQAAAELGHSQARADLERLFPGAPIPSHSVDGSTPTMVLAGGPLQALGNDICAAHSKRQSALHEQKASATAGPKMPRVAVLLVAGRDDPHRQSFDQALGPLQQAEWIRL